MKAHLLHPSEERCEDVALYYNFTSQLNHIFLYKASFFIVLLKMQAVRGGKDTY